MYFILMFQKKYEKSEIKWKQSEKAQLQFRKTCCIRSDGEMSRNLSNI
jgi:hypothetical protein